MPRKYAGSLLARNKSRQRGFNAERELARILWRHGFAVVRGPASGARTRKLFYPDLIAIYKGKIFVIEVKYRSTPRSAIYINREKTDKLIDFAKRAGGKVVIAVKIPNNGWFIVELNKVKYTSDGSIKIDSQVLKEAPRLEDFINTVINVSLEDFIKAMRT